MNQQPAPEAATAAPRQPARRALRLLRRLVISLVLTLLALILLIALALTLFFSQPRLHLWLFSQLDGWTNGVVSVERSEGHLLDSIQLYGISVRHPAVEVDIDRIDWRLDLFKLWHGRLAIDHLHLDRLEIVLPPQPPRPPSPRNEEPFAALLAIPLLLELDDLRVREIHIQRQQQSYLIENLHSALAWQLRRLVLRHLELEHDGHHLQAQGRTTIRDSTTFRGRLALSLDSATLPPLSLNGRWRGSPYDLEFQLNSEQTLLLQSSHHLVVPEEGPLSLHSRWQSLDYLVAPQWPLTSPQGELKLQLAETLKLDGQLRWQLGTLPEVNQQLSAEFDLAERLDLQTRADLGAAGSLSLSARALLGAQQLHARLDSPQLQLGAFLPEQDIRYQGSAIVRLDDFANPRVALQLHNTRLQLPAHDAELGGGLDLVARQLLGPQARPLLDLELRGLTLRQGGHQATLNGPLQLQLDDPSRQQLTVRTERLRIGYLEQQATLQLHAQASPGPQLQLHQLRLDHDSNRITASGHYTDHAQLQLHADLRRLDQLLPELRGALRLDAQLSGPLDDLQTRLWLQGQRLGYQALQLNTLTLTGNASLARPWQSELELSLLQLVQNLPHSEEPWTLLDSLQLARVARTRRTELLLRHPELTLQLAAEDHHEEAEYPGATLQQLLLEHPISGPWQLQRPAAVQWLGDRRLQSEPICLQPVREPDESHLCLQAQREAIHWQLQALPVFTWLESLLPEGFRFAGGLDGSGELQLGEEAGAPWQLQQRLYSRHIAVEVEQLGYQIPLTVHDWTVQLDASPAAASLDAHARLNDSGRLDGRITLDNADGAWPRAALAGDLALRLNELALPEDLTALLDLKEQRIALNSRLSGTLGAPRQQSDAGLELLADLPLLGLRDQQLEIRVDLDDDGLQAAGTLRQPNQLGLSLQARVDGLREHQPSVTLQLTADDVQLIDSPFASLRSAANIQVRLADNALRISGNTRLHHSRIDLQSLPLQERTRVSRDEVILDAAGEPILPESVGPEIHLNLGIVFGEEVLILMRDVHAYLGGTLALQQRPNQEMRGTGRVSLDRGRIDLDPRNSIQIDYSTFTFTGVLGNPTLDVLLSRRVEQYQTHLNVTGTATQPQFVFYSTPSLSQGNIINLMIFGRAVDVDREPNYESQLLSALYKLGLSGNTPVLSQITTSLGIHDVYFDIQDEQSSNLILGRALTNRLYIRYAMGLSERQSNAIQLFYRISKRWSLESLSGDDRQSLDLIWSHER